MEYGGELPTSLSQYTVQMTALDSRAGGTLWSLAKRIQTEQFPSLVIGANCHNLSG
jgi:hypothetical protein